MLLGVKVNLFRFIKYCYSLQYELLIGDQWDKKSRFRGITASFSLNGVGLVEETTDVYQENEELKVLCIQYLA